MTVYDAPVDHAPGPLMRTGARSEDHARRGTENEQDRNVVVRQIHAALLLVLGGAVIATLGILLVKNSDPTKLTAIISVGTLVIGAGVALLPPGAAAGASARIANRSADPGGQDA